MVVNTLIYGILSIAVVALMFSFALPFCRELSTELTGSHWAGNAVCGVATVLMIAPFLRAFMMKKNHSEEFKTLWTERRTNRPRSSSPSWSDWPSPPTSSISPTT